MVSEQHVVKYSWKVLLNPHLGVLLNCSLPAGDQAELEPLVQAWKHSASVGERGEPLKERRRFKVLVNSLHYLSNTTQCVDNKGGVRAVKARIRTSSSEYGKQSEKWYDVKSSSESDRPSRSLTNCANSRTKGPSTSSRSMARTGRGSAADMEGEGRLNNFDKSYQNEWASGARFNSNRPIMASIEAMIQAKERELQEMQGYRIRMLEAAAEEKVGFVGFEELHSVLRYQPSRCFTNTQDREVAELRSKLQKLKEDFQYNLSVRLISPSV